MTLLLEISPCLSTSQGKEQNPPQAYTRPGVTLLPSLSFFHAPTVLPMLSFHFLLYDMHHYLIYHIIYLFISYSRFYNLLFFFFHFVCFHWNVCFTGTGISVFSFVSLIRVSTAKHSVSIQ